MNEVITAISGLVGASMPALVIILKMKQQHIKDSANRNKQNKDLSDKFKVVAHSVQSMKKDIEELKYIHRHEALKKLLKRDIPVFAQKIIGSDAKNATKLAVKIGISKLANVFASIIDQNFDFTEAQIYNLLYIHAKRIESYGNKDCLKSNFKIFFRTFAIEAAKVKKYRNGEQEEKFKNACYELTQQLVKEIIRCE